MRKNKSNWHGSKRINAVTGKRYEYEGTQYRGGRSKGSKNLKKTDTGELINIHNVKFTVEQKNQLEKLVNSVNRKRKRMLEQEENLPFKIDGEIQGTVKNRMGVESDFILARKSKSLHQFKSIKDYDNYINNLKRVNSKNYINERVELYKQNHIKALENVYGSEAKEIIEKINNLSSKEYMKAVQSDSNLEVAFIYDPSEAKQRLTKIKQSFGIENE